MDIEASICDPIFHLDPRSVKLENHPLLIRRFCTRIYRDRTNVVVVPSFVDIETASYRFVLKVDKIIGVDCRGVSVEKR